jgi:uncharacterized protein (TIGR00106 family)
MDRVVADFTIIPIGTQSACISEHIAECQKVLKASGLTYHLHSCGTNIEGTWEEVIKVVKECHKVLHDKGIPRVHTNLSIGTRIDKEGSIAQKMKSVEEKMKEH